MSLVKVWTDVGGRKPVSLLAKIVEKDGVIFTIRYLTAGKDGIWRYEDDTYEIDDDSIAEYLKTDDETAIGFIATDDDGFIREEESDKDYEPSEDEDGDSDEEEFEEEFDDEDENENEEEFEEDEE